MRTSAVLISLRTSSARAAPKISIAGQVLIKILSDAPDAASFADSIVANKSLGWPGKAKNAVLNLPTMRTPIYKSRVYNYICDF